MPTPNRETNPLRRILQLAEGGLEALEKGGAVNGRSALIKIETEARDALRRTAPATTNRALLELTGAFITARGAHLHDPTASLDDLLEAVETFMKTQGVEVGYAHA